jgi:2-dehydropantoate 2-reductase
MNILIVGTGVIGTLYGCALSEKHTISHFVRKEKLNLLDNKKITFDLIDERKDKKNRNTNGSYTYHCVTEANSSYDLIMVPVKTNQLKNVLNTLIQQAPDVNYLLFTLDWNSTEYIEGILNKKQYIWGYAGGGGTIKDKLLWANLGNDIMLGAAYIEQKPLLERTSELFKSCGIIPEIADNPLHWLWIHNAGTAPFGVALAKNNDMNQFLNDRELVNISFLAMRECYQLCKKRGVDLKKYAEVKMISMPLFILYPLFKRNFTKNPVMKRYTAHAIDSINEMVLNFNEMYQMGLNLNADMPNMRILLQIIGAK